MEELSPEELVRRCRQTLPEDLRAFELLVKQYKDRVYAFAYRMMGNREDAEDATQEVFLKVYRGIKELEEPAMLTSWIYRITSNTCLDTLTKRKRRPNTTPMVAPGEDEGNEAVYVDTRALSPEEAALRRELLQCLEAALAELDTVGRAALILRDIEDRSYQEITESLAVGLSAVKMRIHRARLAFQRILNKICPDAWRLT